MRDVRVVRGVQGGVRVGVWGSIKVCVSADPEKVIEVPWIRKRTF